MKFQWPAVQYALFALTAGCVTAHSPDDASEVDAALAPDASSTVDAFRSPDAYVPPDAFCPDSDGDGESDARCGGLDCDDADAQISSTRTHCATPTTVTRCEGAMRVDAACDSATPYCDARTNACVADACGDHVVHSNEQCDDGGPTEACFGCHQRCRSSFDCGTGDVCLPYAHESRPYRIASCVPANPLGGAAFGERCVRDDECYSGLCDAIERRCDESAIDSPVGECAGPHRWSRYFTFERQGDLIMGGSPFWTVCQFECAHNSDCGSDATCVPMLLPVPGIMVAGCVDNAVWPRGVVAQGEPCTFERDCASGVCVFGRCSRQCRDDADCEAGAPRCVAANRNTPPPEAADTWWLSSPRPAEWGTPWPTVCLP